MARGRVVAMAMKHPSPEVPARPAADDEIPTSARRLAKVADEHGWQHRTTYAKGTNIDAQGRPSSVVERVIVRVAKAPEHAVAVWDNGKFHGAWRYFRNPASAVRDRIGARELTKYLRGET